MTSKPDASKANAYWFVGAVYNRTEDQLPRFLKEGIWENGYQDKYLDSVKSIQVGDRIAIKSSYTRKHDLPFDNRGLTVSVMAIKAIGTVTQNLGDGRTVKVDWNHLDPQREWYFYTNRSTIWRVLPGEWTTEALIAFAFEGKDQDIKRFRNAPYWKDVAISRSMEYLEGRYACRSRYMESWPIGRAGPVFRYACREPVGRHSG